MQFNYKLIALLASVFLTGMFLRGEIARRAELKRELREIKDQQKRTMARVDSINAIYAAQRLALAVKTDSLYQQIDEIIRLKSLNGRRITDLQNNIAAQRQQLLFDIHDLRETLQQYPVGLMKKEDN
jgi:Tfp pilus assembly protein PilN